MQEGRLTVMHPTLPAAEGEKNERSDVTLICCKVRLACSGRKKTSGAQGFCIETLSYRPRASQNGPVIQNPLQAQGHPKQCHPQPEAYCTQHAFCTQQNENAHIVISTRRGITHVSCAVATHPCHHRRCCSARSCRMRKGRLPSACSGC